MDSPQKTLDLQVGQQIAATLADISQTLHQLNQTLGTPPTPVAQSNPLWYMEVLEQAATAGWLLTTTEIEQLIGVKPRCRGRKNTYHRGSWTFVKSSKLGTQTAWKVVKGAPQEA